MTAPDTWDTAQVAQEAESAARTAQAAEYEASGARAANDARDLGEWQADLESFRPITAAEADHFGRARHAADMAALAAAEEEYEAAHPGQDDYDADDDGL